MIIANNGKAYLPHLVKQIQNSQTGEIEDIPAKLLYSFNLKPQNLDIVKSALVDVTRPGGTAAKAGANAAYTFAGKTGTSQVIGIKQGERYNEKRLMNVIATMPCLSLMRLPKNPKLLWPFWLKIREPAAQRHAPIARQVFDYFLLGNPPNAGDDSLDDYRIRDHITLTCFGNLSSRSCS